MFDLVWDIKLRMYSLKKEVEWHFIMKRRLFAGFKELITIVPKIIGIYGLSIFIKMTRWWDFSKSIITQKIISIPLIVMGVLYGYYLYVVSGDANQKLFENRLLPFFYYDTAIEIIDKENRLAGTISQPNSFTANPSLIVNKAPKIFWKILIEKYDPKLDLNKSTSSFSNFYLNGIDIIEPFRNTKDVLIDTLWEQKISIKSQKTLTQQLVDIFTKKYYQEKLSNIEKLELCREFYQPLTKNGGINFKRWLFGLKGFFYIDNIGYGLKDTSLIFFGKDLERLTPAEQTILASLYLHPFRLDSSPRVIEKQWKYIKREAIALIEESSIVNRYIISKQIEKSPRPKLPYLPDRLMEVVGKITQKNREAFTSMPNRSKELLQTTREVIAQELDVLYKKYGINNKTKLVTKSYINFHLDDNFYFNKYMEEKINSNYIDNFWISIVNEKGEFVRLYQKNDTKNTPPQPIGNIDKVFTSILFTNRGDRYYTLYCNKSNENYPRERGNKRCNNRAWISALMAFAQTRQLPIYDGFIKYREISSRSDKIYYTPIYKRDIELLYKNLNLQKRYETDAYKDLGLGALKMTPLALQGAIHKVTQLIYRPNRPFYNAQLINKFDYYDINKSNITRKLKTVSLHSPSAISQTFRGFFTTQNRITMKTLLKAPIYRDFGTLQWLKNYIDLNFLFAQESHVEDNHWLVGLFQKDGKNYSFTIHLQDDELSSSKVKRFIKNILEVTLKSVNNPHQMKYQYMKNVFRD